MNVFLGNIEPMECLAYFLHNWLGDTNRATVAAYYFSAQKQKNMLLRVGTNGDFQKDFFQEMHVHKTLKRGTIKPGIQPEKQSSFHNLFLEKFDPNQEADAKIYIYPLLNPYDEKRDLLFVRFHQKKELEKPAQQRSIDFMPDNELYSEIAKVALLVYKLQADYLVQFAGFKTLYSHKCAELSNAQAEINHLREYQNRQKLETAHTIVNSLAEKYKRKCSIDQDAIRRITETEVSDQAFAEAIEKSFFNSLTLTPSDETVVIKSELLYFAPPAGTKRLKEEENVRLNRVKKYLDKLEIAAALVLKEEERLTSENIGRKCDPRLIPAAISDYNKRHRERIQLLMANHLEEWPLIREFKPIKNLLTR